MLHFRYFFILISLNFLFSQNTHIVDFSHFHKEAFVADLHCDAIGRYLKSEDLSKDLPTGHVDIPKLKKGGIDLQVFACFSPAPSNELEKWQSAKNVLRQIDAVYNLVDKNNQDLILITKPEQISELEENNKIGVLIGIEGGYAIENDLALLRDFYLLGVRIMTLTHWTHTDWADASGDTITRFGGLNPFGEQVVKEMNRLGMIIDISHVHDETFWDVINLSSKPIVASHSCCRALSKHHRNLTDDMLRALAQNGGVVGINFEPGYLKAEFWHEREKIKKELTEKLGLPTRRDKQRKVDQKKLKKYRQELKRKTEKLLEKYQIDFKLVVDHIEHVIQVTGSFDNVGLGSDFDGISTTPLGVKNASYIPNITKELIKRGYGKEEIRKILGLNFLRVFKKVSQTEDN